MNAPDRAGERGDEIVEHLALTLIAEQQHRVRHRIMHTLRFEPLDLRVAPRQRRPQFRDSELLLHDGRIARRQQRLGPRQIGPRQIEPVLELLARLAQSIDRLLQRRLGPFGTELGLLGDRSLLREVVPEL